MIQYNTPEEYRAASSLSLCYTDEQILPLCGRPLLDALLSIPGADACWFLAGALPQAQRVEWAQACARRANEYAANAASYDAAYAANAAVARKEEYQIAVRHGVMLLEGVKK